MKYKTSELEGALLDAAVAKAEGYQLDSDGQNLTVRSSGGAPSDWHPSDYWGQGGPIIQRERICLISKDHSFGADHWNDEWLATIYVAPPVGVDDVDEEVECEGSTPLIAAMRAYVASKLGKEVELP